MAAVTEQSMVSAVKEATEKSRGKEVSTNLCAYIVPNFDVLYCVVGDHRCSP